MRKEDDTISSAARWRPCLLSQERPPRKANHAFILTTLFKRKCGKPYIRARRDDVRAVKHFAYLSLGSIRNSL